MNIPMNIPILIGITGKSGSGKDTAFGFIRDWAEERGLVAARRGFADCVKLSLLKMFIPDCSLQEAVVLGDKLKRVDSHARISLSWVNGGERENETTTEITHTIDGGRLAMQRMGTEVGRNVLGENIWLDLLIPPTAHFVHEVVGNFMHFPSEGVPDICVITDVRFNNEARRIRKILSKPAGRGIVIKIHRDGASSKDNHISEMGVSRENIDASILNEGTLDDFRRIVTNIVGDFVDARLL